ncbi:MAG: hypothetical protein ACOC6L_02770 [Thermodesulfobacteriota bacterium]
MPLTSRVFILVAAVGLLLPGPGWAAYRPAVFKGTEEHRVAVPEPDLRTAAAARPGHRTEARVSEPGLPVRLAKAPTTKKKG